MTPKENATINANYRKIEDQASCGNCRFKSIYGEKDNILDQGCIACGLQQFVIGYDFIHHVCDLHKYPEVPSERDLILKKLTPHEKMILGVE